MKAAVNPQVAKKVNDIKTSPEVAKSIADIKAKKELLPGITIIWHKDLKNMDIEEPSYAVDQLIIKGGINGISGLPDSHKSFISLEIAKCMSLGTPFLGKFPTQRDKILLIDEENSAGRVRVRLNTITDEDLDIAILARRGIKIDKPGTPEAIIRLCKSNDIGTVIFDSLSSLHSADENSNSQMAAVFEQLMKLVRAGLTVIFIHHEPKSASKKPENASLRGAGDILAKCDVHISMRHPAGSVNTILVIQLKNRDADRLPEFEIAVYREDDKTRFEYVGELPEQVGKNQRTDEAIIELLIKEGELYQSQIIKALSGIEGIGGQRKIPKRLEALVAAGKLNLRIATDESNRSYYSIKTEQGNE